MMRATLAFVMLTLSAAATAAPDFECGQEKGTRKLFCVDAKALGSNGDLRGAPLWTGGPNGVEKTPYLVIVDCKKQVNVLQDSSGVNFGAGRVGDQPAHMNDLFFRMCGVKTPKVNKKLRMF